MSDLQGNLVWQARYRTWGATVQEHWQAFDGTGRPVDAPVAETGQRTQASAAPMPQNLRMQGQYLDRETGLHYNTFRTYDPELGAFTTPDPIGLAGGVNLYRYAPNPISWIDPWGWEPYGVSANTALPDVLARGAHVNVQIPGSKPIHVGIRPDNSGGIKLVPADPKAQAIFDKNPSQWLKITSGVNNWLSNQSNKLKIARVAEVAKKEIPHKGAEFSHLEKNLKRAKKSC